MAYAAGSFKNSFWETDFLSQTGFETIASHLKEGQKSCKCLEDYLKQRAKAEDDYAKALYKISKSFVGEFGTLRNAMDEVKKEADAEAAFHASTTLKLQEEIAKLTEFRERQREDRKRIEEAVRRSHKMKADLYRKMLHCKNTYENKFKAAEKADSDAEKLRFANKAKDVEKARRTAVLCQAQALKADDEYRTSVKAVEAARLYWVRDHSEACEKLQGMEEDRIRYMRNLIWIFTNLVSDLCLRLDDSRERIRSVTEKCDEVTDIKQFILAKQTCSTPLQKVEYICYSVHNTPTTVTNSPISQYAEDHYSVAQDREVDEWENVYEVEDDMEEIYAVLYNYNPRSQDELALMEGDRIKVFPMAGNGDGWLYGLNMRTQYKGLLPQNYVNKI